MGSSVQNYIIAARTAQGYEEWKSSTEEERLDVVSRWHAVQLQLNRGNSKKGKDDETPTSGFMQTRHMSFDERKKLAKERKKQKAKAKAASQNPTLSRSQSGVRQPGIDPDNVGNASEQSELEEAIQRSVTATSRGDPEEDKLIERAIRASVAELQLASREGDEQGALNRAIQASVAEASQGRTATTMADPRSETEDASNHNRVLAEALRRSVQEQQFPNDQHTDAANNEREDSGIGTDDDQDVQEAIQLSQQNLAPDGGQGDDVVDEDEELQKAIEESKEAHKLREANAARAKTEEEIVFEYVMKQSLAEQEYKDRLGSKGKSKEINDSDYADDDDELKRAMEESLKVHGKAGEGSSGTV